MSSTERRQGLDLGGGADQAHLVAHPLHQRAGDGDGALQGVDRLLVADLVADGGQQAVVRVDGLVAGVHQQEGAGAVGGLGLALGETGLAEQGGLLVAERGGDRDAAEQVADSPVTSPYTSAEERISGSIASGSPSTRTIFSSQSQGVQVHQHGAGGVGDVGDVHAAVGAAGEVPDDPGVHGAEEDVAALGALAQALDVVEQPADLRARRSTMASGRPVSRRKRSWPTLRPSSRHSASVRVSCQTRALWTGSPVFLSHSSGGLALVGDADGLDVGAR